jgi:hypothetical protein
VNRRLRILDLALVAILGFLGWKMRGEWVWAHERAQAFRNQALTPVGVPAPPPLGKLEPLSGTTYAQVAGNNLFSRDRNPNVIIDPEVPKPDPPVPPFPVARGVMLWEGVPPTVVLSEKAGGEQKGYHPGDKIGEWTVVSVDNKYVAFAWNGKEFKKRIDELLDRTPIAVAEAPNALSAAPKPAASQSLTSNSAASAGPGADIGASLKGCVPGDKSPSGTVEGGFKKVVTVSPFGENCRWEPVK